MTVTATVTDLRGRLDAERLAGLPFTDVGNAERLVHLHGRDLRHVPGLGWHYWDGRRWCRDDDGELVRRAQATTQAMRDEAARQGNDGNELWKWAQRSENRPRLEAAIALAAADRQVIARAEQLDADPYLLTALNGVVDLRTGELHDHDRELLTTKLAPVDYDPHARDERWTRFLTDTTGGDGELAGFLQRAAGYTLTGDTSEEVLFFAHGPAAAGKSTLLEALKAALGDYATTADFETFLRRRDPGGPGNGLAQLAGARLVISIEVDEGQALAEALVKAITGGDTVRARFLYRNSFEYVPAFKLWLAANHAPQVRADDDAIWRRILRVPFEQPVPPERRDRSLKSHLRQPNPAVLAWAVEGCLAWQQNGLGVPPSVQRSTDAYRQTMDPLAEFLEERCALNPAATAPSTALWDAYLAFTRHGGDREPLTRHAFVEALKARGCQAQRGNQGRYWTGIQLRRHDA